MIIKTLKMGARKRN
ncbi:TPA: hypothetical protein ACP62H_000836 [Escherichia coli]